MRVTEKAMFFALAALELADVTQRIGFAQSNKNKVLEKIHVSVFRMA
jgi:hypothetical protein